MSTCRYASDPHHTCADSFGQPVAGTDKVCHDEAKAQFHTRLNGVRAKHALPLGGIDRSVPEGDR